MLRWTILTHRYLGIGLGLLMVLWCLSGFVMMYAPYPELSNEERLRHLQPLTWSSCCTIGQDVDFSKIEIEMTEGVPVLTSDKTLINLTTGKPFVPSGLLTSARAYASNPQLKHVIDYDQWTVAGHFNASRPLYLFEDDSRTEIYVSSVSGKVVQVTTPRQRFWGWLGAVPHWLYFAKLRRNTAVWSQVVIWTSLLGTFLTLIGVYLGIRQYLRRPSGRWTAYRGVMAWHHLPGLVFGIFLLTWVFSGLLSMNPWGFLDSEPFSLPNPPISALPPHFQDVVSVESAPLLGQLFWVTTSADGTRRRYDPSGQPAHIDSLAWQQLAHSLGGVGVITEGDEYYSKHPTFRILSDCCRYYLDPLTGAVLETFDSNARWHRWLFEGLHTFNFIRSRPLWDILTLVLLSGATLVAATGAYVGLRRLFR